MSVTTFDRDSMARWYAQEHLKIDPGVHAIYYLPTNAPDREIRLLEVNSLVPDRTDETLEPIDFGVARGSETEHKLFVLDVTPSQWDRIKKSLLALPDDWSLKDAVPFGVNGP